MTSSELRLEARKSLTGKWGKAALLMLVYALITFTIGFVLNLIPTVGRLISFVIDLPISYGLIVSLIKLKRGEEISYTGFLNDGFNSFKQVWIVFGNMLLKLIIPFCLVVVFAIIMAVGGAGTIAGAAYGSSRAAAGLGGVAIIGIIGYLVTLIWLTVKSYLYSLSFFILYDNGEKSGKEIVAESEKTEINTTIDEVEHNGEKTITVDNINLPGVGKKTITFTVTSEEGKKEPYYYHMDKGTRSQFLYDIWTNVQ